MGWVRSLHLGCGTPALRTWFVAGVLVGFLSVLGMWDCGMVGGPHDCCQYRSNHILELVYCTSGLELSDLQLWIPNEKGDPMCWKSLTLNSWDLFICQFFYPLPQGTFLFLVWQDFLSMNIVGSWLNKGKIEYSFTSCESDPWFLVMILWCSGALV